MRESPALDVIEHLHRRATVTYSDPHVQSFKAGRHGQLYAIAASDAAAASPDCVVITTDHAAFDYTNWCQGAAHPGHAHP